MAKDLETLNQVLDFIVRVQPEAAARAASDMEQLNARREDQSKRVEERTTALVDVESRKRLELSMRELDKLEKATRSKYDKEIELLDKLRSANEEKYRHVVDLAKTAATQEKEIKDMLATDDDRRQYEQYTKNLANIEQRRRDAESAQRKESLGITKDGGTGPVAAIGGGIAKGLGPDMAPVMEIVGSISNPIALLGVLVKDVVQLIREGIEDARKRDREMIQLLSTSAAGYQFKGGLSFLDMEALQGRLEASLPPEQRGQAMPALQSLSRSSPETFSTQDIEKVQNRFNILVNAADRLNMSWAEAATKIGDIARKSGESFETAAIMFLETNAAFKKKMQETGETFDLTRLRQNFTDLYDSMRIYNGTIPQASSMVARFAHELDKGILSIGDLVQMQTGMAKADEGQRAFVMNEFISRFQSQGGPQGDTARRLASITQMNPLAMAEAMKRMSEGDTQIAGQLGLRPEQMQTMMMDMGLRLTRNIAEQMSGGNQLIVDSITRQLRVSAGLERDGLSFEQERSLATGVRRPGVDLRQFGGEAMGDLSAVGILRDASRGMIEQGVTGIKQSINEVIQGVRESFNDTGDKIAQAYKDAAAKNRPQVIINTDRNTEVNQQTNGNQVDVDLTIRKHDNAMKRRGASQDSNSGY